MSNAWLGLIMLGTLLGVIFIGAPISFTLLFTAVVFGYVGLGSPVFDLAYLQILGVTKEELLVAVPLFVLMGFIVESAGLMERLFSAFRNLFASVRGSLYIVVILTATLFAMATGIVGAAVTVLGVMASPMMTKAGYDARLSAGAITAGGTLGILLPPSVMLIVMGPVLGVSVSALYAAAVGPGILLTLLYAVYCLVRCWLNPALGPVVPLDERPKLTGAVVLDAIKSIIPLSALIGCTLGVIIAGVATPTEASAVGVVGALLLVVSYGRFELAKFSKSLVMTLTTSSMVLFLAMASNVFGAVFSALGSADYVTSLVLSLELPGSALLALVLALIFLLGWPFEWPAIVLVFVPIFLPIVKALGIDMIWFGTLVAVVLQTAFLSPPVAMSAYYLRQVAPQWGLGEIYAGMFQFMTIQVVCVALVFALPGLATWLPSVIDERSRQVEIPHQYKELLEQQKKPLSLDDEM